MNSVPSSNAITEEILVFGQENANLVGIITDPPAGRRNPDLPAVILLNPGLINRVGPHRLYVKLARALAARGHVVLRFDLSGIGESRSRAEILDRNVGAVVDTFEAMAWLSWVRQARGFVLAGHCSGGWHSLLTANESPSVTGVIALDIEAGDDSWVRYDRNRVYSQFYRNYYLHGALPNAGRWKRFFTGQVDYRSIFRNVVQEIVVGAISTTVFRLKTRLSRHVASPLEGDEMAQDLTRTVVALTTNLVNRKIPVLFVNSSRGAGAEFIDTVAQGLDGALRESGLVRMERLPNSDRLYTLLASQERLISMVCDAVQTMPLQNTGEHAMVQPPPPTQRSG